MAWKLCSKEDVTSIHPATEEELQDTWSDWVEELIREHMGLPNLGTTEEVVDEYHNGDGTDILVVNRPPIVSVTALRINGVLLSPGDYVVFTNYIRLKAQSFPVGTLSVRVSYVSGKPVISPVLRMTAAAMIVAILNYRKRAGADASRKWAGADVKLGEETPNQNVGLTSHLVSIMRRMLKRSYLRVY